jgi:hypothetical protein
VAVKESKDRVYTALLNSGFRPHTGRTTVILQSYFLSRIPTRYRSAPRSALTGPRSGS